MPIFSSSQIVGGGANLVAPITVKTIPMVVDVGPPGALSNSILRQWTDGAVEVITPGPTNVRAGIGAVETFRLANGLISQGSGTDSFVAGRNASAVGSPSIAIGLNAASPALNDITLGGQCITAQDAIAIGFSSIAQSNGGAAQVMSIGTAAVSGGASGGAVSMTIGHASTARFFDLVVGHGSSSSAATISNGQILVGHGIICNVSGGTNYCIGHFINVAGAGAVFSIYIGQQTGGTGRENIIIGHGTAGVANSNTFFCGYTNTDIRTIIIGRGDTAASPAARQLRFTDASGTNNQAGDFTISAPRSTGNATSAAVIIQVGVVGGSGSTLQTLRSVVRADYTATAGQTSLSVWDVDSGTLARVLVGAAGTGPGGAGRALYLA